MLRRLCTDLLLFDDNLISFPSNNSKRFITTAPTKDRTTTTRNTTASLSSTISTTNPSSSSPGSRNSLCGGMLVRYRVVRRVWLLAFLFGIAANIWLISRTSFSTTSATDGRLNLLKEFSSTTTATTVRRRQQNDGSQIVPADAHYDSDQLRDRKLPSSDNDNNNNDNKNENYPSLDTHGKGRFRPMRTVETYKNEWIGHVDPMGRPNTTTVLNPKPAIDKPNVPNAHDNDGCGPTGGDCFSICLLIRDDNELLNEWIAYHYHTIKLRHLIVAVDPQSETSPSELLQVWRSTFPKLIIEEWSDERYMPEYFLEGMYHLVPRMIKWSDNATKWQEHYRERQAQELDGNAAEAATNSDNQVVVTKQQLQEGFTKINNHRYRQSKFLRECMVSLKQQNRTWMTHIDTDEYIVINPLLRRMGRAGNISVPNKVAPTSINERTGRLTREGKNIIYNFWKRLVALNSYIVNVPCSSMPRVLFGSYTDFTDQVQMTHTDPESTFVLDTYQKGNDNYKLQSIDSVFNRSKFESLRWKYHASFTEKDGVTNNNKVNGLAKVIVDVSGFDWEMLGNATRVFSIHRPSKFCRRQAQMNMMDGRRYPLTVNHYIGTFERYQSRKDDPRRSRKTYNEKAMIKDGKDDQFIDGWLESFVEEYGVAKSAHVLQNYIRPDYHEAYLQRKVTQDARNAAIARIAESPSIKPSYGIMSNLEGDSFSACLLLKDDNEILNEWLAYHYHTLKLRSLIVAIDPSSTTSPTHIFDKWRKLAGMEIQEWEDRDFMPEFFLNKEYDLVPDLLTSKTDMTKNSDNGTFAFKWFERTAEEIEEQEAKNAELSAEAVSSSLDDLKEEKVRINNHRFRQKTFLGECFKSLNARNKTWVTHIDTDEYIVIHPEVRNNDKWKKISIAPEIGPSSTLLFLKQVSLLAHKFVNYPCIGMPRLLFGSLEDNETESAPYIPQGDYQPKRKTAIPKEFDKRKFESVRWKYHSDYDNDEKLNGLPKVIVDISGVPRVSGMLNDQIFSIHRPGLHLCRSKDEIRFDQKWKTPVTVNHYLGSWDRYISRNDARRTREGYEAKANVSAGKDSDNWITGWVESFVNEHGLEVASELLGDYLADGITIPKESDILEVESVSQSGDEDDNALKEVRLEAISGFKNMTESVPSPNRIPKPVPPSIQNFNESARDSFSACMLYKDDNNIFDEWLAYHYHTIGLRHLIVALDSKSTTSPEAILDKWRKFGMDIEVWTDHMFMPDFFFQKAYHLFPRLAKIKKNKYKWLDDLHNRTRAEEFVHAINEHRFRQVTFVSECTKALRAKNRTWMVHIDTDEYIVLNPVLRERRTLAGKQVHVSSHEPNVVLRLLNEISQPLWEWLNYPCISMPRLLYGSTESEHSGNTVISKNFNISRFETLRWKYHSAYDDEELNKQPKVIMDVSAIPADDKMLTENRAFSIHRPSQPLCRSQGQMDFSNLAYYPFTVNHYLGTFERFNARGDMRRNRRVYDSKAQVQAGKDDDWIDGWLTGFIEQHGIEKVSHLLNDYVLKN